MARGERWGRLTRHLADGLSPTRRAALKPLMSILSAVLMLMILLEATRRGQLAEIAGYSVGASFGAIVSGVAGSGTSLAFITGNATEQAAVRRIRYVLVAPLMILGVGIACIIYHFATDLKLFPILLGGLAVVFNNLAELESAVLERKLQTPKMLTGTVVSRCLGLVAVLIGVSFSAAMLICSALSYLILKAFAKSYTARTKSKPGLKSSVRLAYAPSLMSVSVLGVIINRAVLIFAPFLTTADAAGAVASLVSAQQSITAVLISALYTVMAARAESGRMLAWMRVISDRTMIFAIVVSAGAAACAPIIPVLLNLELFPASSVWWLLLALAVVPYTYNRMRQYAFLGASLRKNAALLLSLNAAVALGVCVIALLLECATLLVAASVIAETVTAVVVKLTSGGGLVPFRKRLSSDEKANQSAD